MYKKATYLFDENEERSRYFPLLQTILLVDDNGGTMTHELFHFIDDLLNITSDGQLGKKLRENYNDLFSGLSEQQIVKYLKNYYPHAFENPLNSDRMKKEYRGIADIINGLTKGSIRLGFGHSTSYWNSSDDSMIKEAWAQFGRIMYCGDPEVIAMLYDLFPDFADLAVNKCK